MSPRMGRFRAGALAVVAAAGLSLAACGGSTVESADVTDTDTAAPESASADASSSEASSSATSEKTTSREPSRERDINDPAATRASGAPDGRMPLTGDDEKFLDALIADGIDVEGTEDQLIAAGHVQCTADADDGPAGDSAVVGAVAGQLVAQGRTDKDEAGVAEAIAKAARQAYC